MSDFTRPIEASPEAAQAPMRPRPAYPRARALPSAPAPALERPRPAPGAFTRPAAAEPAEEGPVADDIRHERMRIALGMELEGRTHAEIATHFGRSIRAIRYWLSEARDMRLVDFHDTRADEVLAEMQASIRHRLEMARRKLREADEAGEDRRADLWMRRISDLEQQYLALLERIGAMDALRADRQAERDQDAQADPVAAWDDELRKQGIDPEEMRRRCRADADRRYPDPSA